MRSVGLVVPAAAAAVVLAGCGGPARAEVVLVRASEEGFAPARLTVPVGTEVRWVNDGPLMQSITPVQAQGGAEVAGWGTDRLQTGETYAVRFDEAGRYTYESVLAADQGPLFGVVEVREP